MENEIVATAGMHPAVYGGISLLASWGFGAFKKHKTKLPNVLIPYTNTSIMAGAVAAITQNPTDAAAAAIGSIAATALHTLFKKMKGW